jgi:hypothetical protein
MDRDSVDDILGQDHLELGAVLQALRAGAPAALDAFRRFEARLRKHMAWEDDALFPAVRAHATAAEARSIDSLEIDPERIRETLDGVAAALGSSDADLAARGLDRLDVYLRGHNYDEEHGVYVEADRYLELDERRRLLRRFEED